MSHSFRSFPVRPIRDLLRFSFPILVGALVLLAGEASPALSDDILPFREVKVGMKGEGRSVFEGTRVSTFGAEVIGLMENIAPQRNLILVRLSGDPVDRTGVMEGMSGSPIYVEGRVIGAVAYSWEFSKEAIAGVTPIEEMLEVQRRGAGTPGHSRTVSPLSGASPVSAFFRPAEILRHFDSYFQEGASGAEEVANLNPIRTPLFFSGFPTRIVERLAPDLSRVGLVPVQAGVAAGGKGVEAPLVPGSAVAAKLVKGDVEISAIGTVTYRSGDQILAFGHPLLNLGPTSLPMSGAVVHSLLPSLASSFKIASPAGDEIGSIQQDRSVGISGSAGVPSRLIPVRVEISGNTPRTHRYGFDVMEDSFLTPYLVYAALNAILSDAQKDYGEVTVKLKEGSVLKVAGEQDIQLDNLFSGDLASFYASGTVAYISQLMLNNEYRPVHITGINLLLEYTDERRTARVERVWCERDRVKAGEKVGLTVSLKPFQGGEITRTLNLTLPEELTPGRVFLQVGDGLAVSRREEEGTQELHPRDLAQLIWLINHIRTNDNLYVILSRPDNGIFFQGTRMPDLPPSKALIMLRPQTEGNFLRLGVRGISEESIPTTFAIEGYKTLTLEVEE